MLDPIKCLGIINEAVQIFSFSQTLLKMIRIVNIASRVPDPDLKPKCVSPEFSLSKTWFLFSMILSRSFMIWLMRLMVLNPPHSIAFGFWAVLWKLTRASLTEDILCHRFCLVNALLVIEWFRSHLKLSAFRPGSRLILLHCCCASPSEHF